LAGGDVSEIAELISCDFEATLAMEDLDQIMQAQEEYEKSYSAVERLHDIIDRDGISRGLMEFADPARELEAIPGFPAMESLDMVPVKDSNAIAAMEGFEDTMKKWGENIKKFFKMIWEQIQKVFGAVVQLFSKYETTLKKVAEKLKDVSSLDDEKIKKEVKCLEMKTMDDLKDTISAATIWKGLEFFLKDDQLTILGLKKEEKDVDGKKVVTFMTKDIDRKPKAQSIKDHGFDAKWCSGSVAKAIEFCGKMRESKYILKACQDEQKAAEAKLKSLEKATEKDDKAKKEVEAGVKMQKARVLIYSRINKCTKEYISNVITASNAVIGAKK
jgi:hypothetical protein